MRVIEKEYDIGEIVFKREEPPLLLHRAISKNDNKQYLIKIWRKSHKFPIETQIYQKRFNNEISIIDQAPQQLKTFLPTLLQHQSQVLVSETDPEIVSFQLFQNIKYNSLTSYHYQKRLIPQNTAIHIFKKVTQAVKIFHSIGKTFLTIDPKYILIDQNGNPIFMDLSNSRELNHSETASTFDNFRISKHFQPPESQKNNQTFNLSKMDSFQLGIFCFWILSLGVAPFQNYNKIDPKYWLVIKGDFKKLFELMYDKQKKPDDDFWDLFCSLINHHPSARLDVKDVQNSKWWKTNENQISNIKQFELFVDKIQELKKQHLNSSNLVLSNEQSKSNHVLFSKLDFRSSDQESYNNLNPSVYKSKRYADCYFWMFPLCWTFSLLKNTAINNKYKITTSERDFQFQASIYEGDVLFRMLVQVYFHASLENVTVVRYSLLDDDVFYFNDIFQKSVQMFEMQKKNILAQNT